MSGDLGVPDGAHVHPTDADFCVAQVSRDDLLALQADAESRGFGTRWSSVEAMLRAVGPSPAYLRPLLRERREGHLRSYRCLLLFFKATAGGGVTTFDIAPERLGALPRLTLDPQARQAVSRMFDLALNGLTFVTKD